MPEQQPLELILARNLIGAIRVPALLVDADGGLAFYNESAGELIGRRFEDTGRLSREEWNEIGPVDERGRPLGSEDLPLTVALRHGRPAHERFRIRTDADVLVEIEAVALPLEGAAGFQGAIAVFWPAAAGDGRDGG